jgi:hypothetical protein
MMTRKDRMKRIGHITLGIGNITGLISIYSTILWFLNLFSAIAYVKSRNPDLFQFKHCFFSGISYSKGI